ncbi:glycosyltransferase family 87 protein [Rhodovulum sp. YNF3179]|uniref:glycosyltransferase family 87 protein n=1 Tax=Rhodovulum sp. YNF3179 TaxID=3425127 RepID=UPI003D358D8B
MGKDRQITGKVGPGPTHVLQGRRVFLTEHRLRAYPKILIASYLLSAAIIALFLGTDRLPFPRLGTDFVAMYGAGLLAAQGMSAEAYDARILFDAYREVLPSVDYVVGWAYPPVILPLFHALAKLPFALAYTVWMTGTAVFFAITLRPVVRSGAEGWLIAAAPAVVYTVITGQASFLVAGLIVLFIRLLDDKPARAGIALGLVCVKPHLTFLFPILVLASRKWRALVTACVSAGALVAFSILLYGLDPWKIFLSENPGIVSEVVAGGYVNWRLMSSPFTFALSLGAARETAMALQVAFSVLLCGLIVFLLVKGASLRSVATLSMAAAVPATPYNFAYDWVLLVLPLLRLAYEPRVGRLIKTGVILTLYLFPFLMIFVPLGQNLSFGFLFFLPLLGLLTLICWREAVRND